MLTSDEYVLLKNDWTIRGSSDKFTLFDFRKGIFEERFDISQRVHAILTLSDGQHTISEIGTIIGSNPIPFLEYLQQLEVLDISPIPTKKSRSFQKPYEGDNFLGRIMFHITGRCNQECKHCYMASQKWDELSLGEISEVIQQATELNVASFSITGGEPFIREDVLDILQELDRKEMKIEGVFTNGTMITSEFIRQVNNLQELPFFVSINGPSSESHDRFGQINGGFNQTIKAISMLVEEDIKVFGNTSLNVFTEDKKDVREIYNLVKSLGIYRWRVSGPFLEGNWKTNFQTFGVSPEKELSILIDLLQMWLYDEKPFEIELGHIFRYIEGQCIRRHYKRNDYVCDYFRDRIVLMPDGSVGACSLLVTPQYLLGNIREQSLRTIWESAEMRYYKDLKISDITDDRCHECRRLPECGLGCRANAALIGGNYEGFDSEICGICLHPLYDKFEEIIEHADLQVVEE